MEQQGHRTVSPTRAKRCKADGRAWQRTHGKTSERGPGRGQMETRAKEGPEAKGQRPRYPRALLSRPFKTPLTSGPLLLSAISHRGLEEQQVEDGKCGCVVLAVAADEPQHDVLKGNELMPPDAVRQHVQPERVCRTLPQLCFFDVQGRVRGRQVTDRVAHTHAPSLRRCCDRRHSPQR